MKHMRWDETNTPYFVIIWLFSSIFSLSLSAQTFDTTPPFISHQPVKLSKMNYPLPLIAYISDNTGIREASVKVSYQGESQELAMWAVSKEQLVPIKIKLLASRADVFLGPGNHFKKVGELFSGQTAVVTFIHDKYYRIITETGLAGFVEQKYFEAIEKGWEYRVSLPAKATEGKSLSYQIFAMDNFGNESQTSIIDVKLISEQELLNLQKQLGMGKGSSRRRTEMAPKSGPFYTRTWFWLTAAAVGGGAYYLLANEEDNKRGGTKATVNVIIGW